MARRDELARYVLPAPTSVVTLQRSGVAGSIWISGVPVGWEATRPQLVSWFPSGSATSAVASPSPGSVIRPHTPITLTFSKTVAAGPGQDASGRRARYPGTWQPAEQPHDQFVPTGYGYGLGAKVSINAARSDVRLLGGQTSSSSDSATGGPARLDGAYPAAAGQPGVSAADLPADGRSRPRSAPRRAPPSIRPQALLVALQRYPQHAAEHVEGGGLRGHDPGRGDGV